MVSENVFGLDRSKLGQIKVKYYFRILIDGSIFRITSIPDIFQHLKSRLECFHNCLMVSIL